MVRTSMSLMLFIALPGVHGVHMNKGHEGKGHGKKTSPEEKERDLMDSTFTKLPEGTVGPHNGEIREHAGCGVVMGGFGESYSKLASRVAKHIRSLKVEKGWCPTDPELDHIPMTLFTDSEDTTTSFAKTDSRHGVQVKVLHPPTKWEISAAHETLELPKEMAADFHANISLSPNSLSEASLLECEPGVTCHNESDMQHWDGEESYVQGHLGSWRIRWYHAQMLLASSYSLALYVDVDALPCSGKGVSQLLTKLHEAGAGTGTIIHTRKPCAMTGNDCVNPHPKGLSAHDIRKWAKFPERNAGTIAYNMKLGKSVAKDFAREILRSSHTDKIKGDQFAFRSALFQNRKNVKEVTFKDKEICRYSTNTCETGCAVYHHEHLGALKRYLPDSLEGLRSAGGKKLR